MKNNRGCTNYMRLKNIHITFLLAFFICLFSSSPLMAKDRALLIGIDYYKLASETPGATTDVKVMEQFLISKLKFESGSIHTLLNEQATAENIKQEFQRWLIAGTETGDRIFFHYSGHGSQVPDKNGDEKDGWDEVIAPFDVMFSLPLPGQPVIPSGNYISDDDIGEWLGQLAGRRVVLVFDSCHSGTISRSVGSKKPLISRYLRAKNMPQASSRSMGDIYSPSSKTGRDLTIIKEEFLDGTLNGVTIFSAAKSDQEALPIITPTDGYVGAFTYLFTQKQKNNLLPLGELSQTLKSGMVELKTKGLLEPGRNGKYQEPEVETISTMDMNDAPIFGGNSWQSAPLTALVNPLSTIQLGLRIEGNKKSFKLEELIRFSVTTNSAGYLYVLVFSENNEATCLFPSNLDNSNKVTAGTYAFPRGEYEFFAQEPVGRDVWVALITEKPLSLGEKDSYTWSEMFSKIGLPKLQEAVGKYTKDRGVGKRPVLNTWQAATMIVEVRK